MSEVKVKKAKEMPTLEEINRLLDYDPETGIFTWKAWLSNNVKIGDIAGRLNKRGYIQIGIKGEGYSAHRIAKFITDGLLDAGMDIDHINGSRADNGIVNLRYVTKSINAQNQRNSHKRNKLGVLGVSEKLGKFRAQIKPPGKKNIHLGTFNTPEKAHEAYLKAKRELHEGCTI